MLGINGNSKGILAYEKKKNIKFKASWHMKRQNQIPSLANLIFEPEIKNLYVPLHINQKKKALGANVNIFPLTRAQGCKAPAQFTYHIHPLTYSKAPKKAKNLK